MALERELQMKNIQKSKAEHRLKRIVQALFAKKQEVHRMTKATQEIENVQRSMNQSFCVTKKPEMDRPLHERFPHLQLSVRNVNITTMGLCRLRALWQNVHLTFRIASYHVQNLRKQLTEERQKAIIYKVIYEKEMDIRKAFDKSMQYADRVAEQILRDKKNL